VLTWPSPEVQRPTTAGRGVRTTSNRPKAAGEQDPPLLHRRTRQRLARGRPPHAAPTTRPLVVVALLAFVLGATPADAQTRQGLSENIIRSTSIGSSQAAEISAYAGLHAEDLLNAGDNPAGFSTAARAIEQLLEPLENPGVTVAFRQRYAEALDEALDRLLESDSTWRRLTALRLSGRLATERTLQRVRGVMRSEQAPEADRLYAITAAELVFQAAQQSAPAVSESSLRRLIESLGRGVVEGDDPWRVDARIRALIAAAGVPADRLGGLSDEARRTLARSAAERLRGADPERREDDAEARAILRAALYFRNQLAPVGSASEDVARAAAGLSGDMAAYLLARSEAGVLQSGDPQAFDAQFANIAEILADLSDRRLGEAIGSDPSLPRVNLRAPLAGGDMTQFEANALRLTQALTQRPFNFDASRFDR